MRRILLVLLSCMVIQGVPRSLLPQDSLRAKELAAQLEGMVKGFMVVGLSDADPALTSALAYLPSSPRVVFDLAGLNKSYWFEINESPAPSPSAVVFLLGKEKGLWKRLGTLLTMFRDSTFWNISASMIVEAPSLTFLDSVFEHFYVEEALGLRWTGDTYKRVPLLADGPGPGRFILMVDCAPELQNVPSDHFSPEEADQYLARLLIQRIPRLQETECMVTFNISLIPYFPNGSLTPGFKMFHEGEILLSSSGSLQDKFFLVSYLYPHTQDDYCLEVRRSDPIPFLEGVVLIFTPSTWAAFGGSLLTFVGVEFIVSRCFPKGLIKPAQGIIDSFFSTLRTAVTGCFSASRGVGLSAGRRRALRFLLSLCSLVVTNAFGGSLTSHLSQERYPPNLNTISEVDAAVKHVHILPIYIKRFAALEDGDVVQHLSRKFIPTFYSGSSYQGGLYQKFERNATINIHVKWNSSVGRVGAPPPHYKPYVLGYRHLGGAFRGIALSLGLAIVVFALELVFGRYGFRRTKLHKMGIEQVPSLRGDVRGVWITRRPW